MSICLSVSSVDWSLTKDIVTTVGTGAAVAIGFLGLNTWRRQQRGTSEFEVAKKAVLKSYELQLAAQSVRNPMIYLSTDEIREGRRLQDEQRIYQERLDALIPIRAELQTLGLEAKVLWGESARNCFDSLNSAIEDLHGGIWMHFWLKGAYAGPGATVDNSSERIIENNKIVYYLSEDDDFSRKLFNAITEVETYFQPKIHGHKRMALFRRSKL